MGINLYKKIYKISFISVNMKKGLLLVGFFALIFFISSFASAWETQCYTGDSCPQGYEQIGTQCCLIDECYVTVPPIDDTITCNNGITPTSITWANGGCASSTLISYASDDCYEYCCPIDSCTYLECYGTYNLPVGTCQSYCATNLIFSFLLPLTGNLISGCSETQDCEDLPQNECTDGCAWVTSETTGSCSEISESACNYYPGCTASYDCSDEALLPPLTGCGDLLTGDSFCTECKPFYSICEDNGKLVSYPCEIESLCWDNTCAPRIETECFWIRGFGDSCIIGDDCEANSECIGGICQCPTGTVWDGSTCVTQVEPPEPVVYWADESDPEIPIDTSQTNYIYFAGDKLKLVAINLEPGATAIFEIYEDDSPLSPAEIRVGESAFPPVIVNSEGVAVVEWTITSLDVQEALQRGNDGGGDPSELYFRINDNLESEQLITELKEFVDDCEGITLCEHYNPSSIDCNNDNCNIGNDACSNYICRCEWDDTEGCVQVGYDEPNINTNVCVWCIDVNSGAWCDMSEGTNDYCDTTGTGCGIGDSITNSLYCDAIDFTIGSCTYITDDSGDPEGCDDDGYLTYLWGGQWGWNNVANSFDPPDPDPEGDDFLEDPLGIWRYAPINETTGFRDNEACDAKGGTNSAICSAQIELPFFGTWGIIITIGLIVLIYVVLNMKKHKPKKRKK